MADYYPQCTEVLEHVVDVVVVLQVVSPVPCHLFVLDYELRDDRNYYKISTDLHKYRIFSGIIEISEIDDAKEGEYHPGNQCS